MDVSNHLCFDLNGITYALPALLVSEVIPLPELTPADEFPAQISGLFNLRGTYVPVTDLEYKLTGRFHLCKPSDIVIVLMVDGHLHGLIVSEVLEVRNILSGDITPVQSVLREDERVSFKYLSGITSTAEGIVFLLSIERILDFNMPQTTPDETDTGEETQYAVQDHERYFAPRATDEERAIYRERALAFRIDEKSGGDDAGKAPTAVFLLNGEYFGLDLKCIVGFYEIKGYTPVPCCPPHIIGQTNFHGSIITLVDIRSIFVSEVTQGFSISKVILIRLPEGEAGIPVDEIVDVVYLSQSDMLSLPTASRSVSEVFQLGAANYKEKMLTIIDIEKILLQGGLTVHEEF